MKKPNIRMVDTSALIPSPRNSKKHDEIQIAKIAGSIREYGFTNPVLIDGDNGILAGHGRWLAAQKLELGKVPCICLDHLSETQKRAYMLADNRLAEIGGGWDMEALKIELEELAAEEIDLDALGFGDDFDIDLDDDSEGTEGLTNDDEVPEPPEVPVTVEGDVWLLGRHRLMCGDSTSINAVEKLMAGQKADLCFTSPPYAQQRDYKAEISDWDVLMNGVFSIVPVKIDGQILVNLGLVHGKGRVDCYWDKWLDFMDSAEWPLFGWYVWDKGFGLPGNWNGRLAPAHEFIFHFSRGGNKPANKCVEKKTENVKLKSGTGVRRKDGTMSGVSSPETGLQPKKIADSVIRVTPQMGKSFSHPAMFPVALCEAMYKSYAKAGDWAYEPFSGSGTSIIACEKMGMSCAAMELAPEYADIAVKRWQDFTGQQATHESSGKTFDKLKAAK